MRGDVVYYAPCGKKFKQYPDIIRYLEKNEIQDLAREHFSFSTKIFIGEFLKPTGMMENGEEKYLRLNEQEMLIDVDKIRAENGWKPRKRSSDQPAQPSRPSKQKKTQSSSDGGNLTQSMTPEQKILARLQAEVQLREQVLQQQEELRLQKEAYRQVTTRIKGSFLGSLSTTATFLLGLSAKPSAWRSLNRLAKRRKPGKES